VRRLIWKTLVPLLIWAAISSCATAPTARFSVADLAGSTWVNKDYPVGREDLRIRITSEGEMQLFDSLTAETPKLMKRIRITKTWRDDKGDIWFQDTAERKWATSAEYTGASYFELNRISKSLTVWEITSSQDNYPTEMGFVGGAYSIRFRQE
jgi:hypothetical protein